MVPGQLALGLVQAELEVPERHEAQTQPQREEQLLPHARVLRCAARCVIALRLHIRAHANRVGCNKKACAVHNSVQAQTRRGTTAAWAMRPPFAPEARTSQCQRLRAVSRAQKGTEGGPLASTRILGRRTAPFPPSLISNRVPYGFTQDPGTGKNSAAGPRARSTMASAKDRTQLKAASASVARCSPRAQRSRRASGSSWTRDSDEPE